MPYQAKCDECGNTINVNDVIYELRAMTSPTQPPMWTRLFHWKCIEKFLKQ